MNFYSLELKYFYVDHNLMYIYTLETSTIKKWVFKPQIIIIKILYTCF